MVQVSLGGKWERDLRVKSLVRRRSTHWHGLCCNEELCLEGTSDNNLVTT